MTTIVPNGTVYQDPIDKDAEYIMSVINDFEMRFIQKQYRYDTGDLSKFINAGVQVEDVTEFIRKAIKEKT